MVHRLCWAMQPGQVSKSRARPAVTSDAPPIMIATAPSVERSCRLAIMTRSSTIVHSSVKRRSAMNMGTFSPAVPARAAPGTSGSPPDRLPAARAPAACVPANPPRSLDAGEQPCLAGLLGPRGAQLTPLPCQVETPVSPSGSKAGRRPCAPGAMCNRLRLSSSAKSGAWPA
jgi:hypothetical protein